MNRILKFLPEDIVKFATFFNLFILGGNTIYTDRQSRSRDERSKEAKILKKLKLISNEIENGNRTMKSEGGDLILDSRQYELLVKYLNAAPAPTQLSDVIDELLDWVDSAEKINGSE